MSRLLPGLTLVARSCRSPAARAAVAARPQVSVRALSSTTPGLSFKPWARPAPPASATTSPAAPSSIPSSLPPAATVTASFSGLTSHLGLSMRRFSSSPLSLMRPTYFRDRPPAPRPPPNWWRRFRNRLDSLPPNYVVYAIIGINIAVFLMWQYAINSWQRFRDPSLYNWMFKNFILNEINIRSGRVWTLITSCFSHMSGAHIFFNCLGLYFVAPACVSLIGTTAFLGLYLSGGLFSALCSLAYQHLTPGRKTGGSEGASGAIYTTLAFFATIYPTATFLLFFIVPMPAWLLVGGMFGYDFYQAITGMQSRTDSAGHAGGIFAGVVAGLLARRRGPGAFRRRW